MEFLILNNFLKLSTSVWIGIKIDKSRIYHSLIACFQPNLFIKLLYFLEIMFIKFMLIGNVFQCPLIIWVTLNNLVFFVIILSIDNIRNFTVMIYLMGDILLSYRVAVLHSAYYFNISPWWCQYFVYFCCCTSFFIHFYI